MFIFEHQHISLKFTILETKLKPKNKNSNTRPGKLSQFPIWSLSLSSSLLTTQSEEDEISLQDKAML